ncbi:hypothetical protein Syun_022988 [Stephania yunnanensis]|uniref:Uncharacterized protein n=1 Tax=Stephania yunnanensis TaxID=152371 RepID=A0AAP0I1X7_9MAGN
MSVPPAPPSIKKLAKATKPFFPPSASPIMPSYKTPLSDEFFDILTTKLSQLKISPTTGPSTSQPHPSPPAPPKGPSKDKGPVIMTLAPASTPPDTQGDSVPASPIPISQPSFSSEETNADILPEIHLINPKTPMKLATFPARPSSSSSFKDAVAKPSPPASSDMAIIFAKLQQIEDDNKQLRQQIETDHKQSRGDLESRYSPSPSNRSVHLSDDEP